MSFTGLAARAPSLRSLSTRPRELLCAWKNNSLLGFGGRGDTLQLCQRFFRIARQRSMRHYLQIGLVVLDCILKAVEFFKTLSRTEVCNRVIRFVEQCFLIATERGLVIFLPEVKISHFDILHRLVRIPRMEFLHLGVVRA